MHRDGFSFSQIAAEVSRIVGVSLTRDAIIGRGQRMKPPLPMRAKVVRRDRVYAKAPKREPIPPHRAKGRAPAVPPRLPRAVPKPVAAPPDAKPVVLLDLEHHHCRWPLDEPQGPETLFCGAAKDTGSSYCAYHRWASRSAM